MCRIGAIKSKTPVEPVLILRMMTAMQKGHDNSGFAMVMQDLDGVFLNYKKYPLLSMACTSAGLKLTDDFLKDKGFEFVNEWIPETSQSSDLNFERMPHYVFRNYDYPPGYRNQSFYHQKKILVETRLELREKLIQQSEGFVYSFWPDVLTLKEIGDPRDIGFFFRLWDEDYPLKGRVISAQCRQNTNYQIVRYAAHPFFLEGYTLMGNGENTFYQKNKEFQQTLNPAYIGFESDTQCFLYTLHYVLEQLRWPLIYYKHVITPLPFEDIDQRQDAGMLLRIRQSCQQLEINGPNSIIFVMPDGQMGIVTDAKKLRPLVIGRQNGMVVAASEVCGVNMIIPERQYQSDLYPGEREMIIIDNELEVHQCQQ